MQPKFRKRNPFELPDQHSPDGNNDGSPLLGDMVARATKAVGIKPCAPCAKRQAALNRATPGWLSKILLRSSQLVDRLKARVWKR